MCSLIHLCWSSMSYLLVYDHSLDFLRWCVAWRHVRQFKDKVAFKLIHCKKKIISYLPAFRDGRIVKNCDLAPENVANHSGLGQRFQDLGCSFSLYGLYRPADPKSRQIKYISFLSCGKFAFKSGFVLAASTLSLNRLIRRLQTCKKFERANERKTRVLDKEVCSEEQIYCELLYVSCIY